MYPSDHYLVYANGVDAVCYADPTKCLKSSGTAGSNGIPTAGWIYNSNNFEGQSLINYNNWFVSPGLDVESSGYVRGYTGTIAWDNVRPILYLSSNVKITDGTGEQNNPYKLGL